MRIWSDDEMKHCLVHFLIQIPTHIQLNTNNPELFAEHNFEYLIVISFVECFRKCCSDMFNNREQKFLQRS